MNITEDFLTNFTVLTNKSFQTVFENRRIEVYQEPERKIGQL